MACAALGLALPLSACANAGTNTMNPEDSPLRVSYPEIAYDEPTQAEEEAAFREHEVKEQEFIAQCMAPQGFEYIPDVGRSVAVIGTPTQPMQPWTR